MGKKKIVGSILQIPIYAVALRRHFKLTFRISENALFRKKFLHTAVKIAAGQTLSGHFSQRLHVLSELSLTACKPDCIKCRSMRHFP